MNPGSRVAAAIGAGYLLGRTRKLRLALMLAFAGATGALEERTRALLEKGTALLGSSAELDKINEMKDDVVDAAKAAAIMAATRRIDKLSKHIAPNGAVNGAVKTVSGTKRAATKTATKTATKAAPKRRAAKK